MTYRKVINKNLRIKNLQLIKGDMGGKSFRTVTATRTSTPRTFIEIYCKYPRFAMKPTFFSKFNDKICQAECSIILKSRPNTDQLGTQLLWDARTKNDKIEKHAKNNTKCLYGGNKIWQEIDLWVLLFWQF